MVLRYILIKYVEWNRVKNLMLRRFRKSYDTELPYRVTLYCKTGREQTI